MEPETRIAMTDEEIRNQVELRAYELYRDRGGQHGRDIDDWLQAETEVVAEAEQQKRFSARKQSSPTSPAEAPKKRPKTAKKN
ncbi:MAG: DUF2934 domain-containing protein [Acidobacteria bacterium]|nr:DUF2934 domain-containing protein [Acidobacteriota bacterium]